MGLSNIVYTIHELEELVGGVLRGRGPAFEVEVHVLEPAPDEGPPVVVGAVDAHDGRRAETPSSLRMPAKYSGLKSRLRNRSSLKLSQKLRPPSSRGPRKVYISPGTISCRSAWRGQS